MLQQPWVPSLSGTWSLDSPFLAQFLLSWLQCPFFSQPMFFSNLTQVVHFLSGHDISMVLECLWLAWDFCSDGKEEF